MENTNLATIALTGSLESEYYIGDTIVIPYSLQLPENYTDFYAKVIPADGGQEGHEVFGFEIANDDYEATTNAFNHTPTQAGSASYRIQVAGKKKDVEDAIMEAIGLSDEFTITVAENTAKLDVTLQKAVLDDTITLSASIDSILNDLDITWYKDGEEIPSQKARTLSITRQELTQPLSSEDQVYKVKVRGNLKRGKYRNEKEVTVNLSPAEYYKDASAVSPEPPSEESPRVLGNLEFGEELSGTDTIIDPNFTRIGGDTVVVQEEAPFNIGLNVVKTPDETKQVAYTWYKDGTHLEAFTTPAINVQSAKKTDAGQYTLKVTTLSNTNVVKTESITIRVEVAARAPDVSDTEEEPQATPQLSQTNLGIVHEGDLITLTLTGTAPDALIQWYGRDKEDQDTLLPGVTGTRVQVSATIEMAKGLYAKISKGVEITDSPFAAISSFRVKDLQVTSQASSVTLEERATYQHSITVVPLDTHTRIVWKHESADGQVEHLHPYDNQVTMEIPSVSEDSAGTYYAEVTRLDAPAVRSKSLTVTVRKVETPIQFNIQLDKTGVVKVPTGGTFALSATVDNQTDGVTFQWFKKTEAGTAIVRGQTTTGLIIQDVHADDEGYYSLNVSKGISSSNSEWVQLSVVDRPLNVPDLPKVTPPAGNPDEDKLAGRNYQFPEVALRAARIRHYCNNMYYGIPVKPEVAMALQHELYRDLLYILHIKDYDIYMSAMDMVVDHFYVFRETVFRMELRNRYVPAIPESLMTVDDKEAFSSLMELFVYMADPRDKVAQHPREVLDVVVNQLAVSRFIEYLDAKVKTKLEATLLGSEEWRAQAHHEPM